MSTGVGSTGDPGWLTPPDVSLTQAEGGNNWAMGTPKHQVSAIPIESADRIVRANASRKKEIRQRPQDGRNACNRDAGMQVLTSGRVQPCLRAVQSTGIDGQ